MTGDDDCLAALGRRCRCHRAAAHDATLLTGEWLDARPGPWRERLKRGFAAYRTLAHAYPGSYLR